MVSPMSQIGNPYQIPIGQNKNIYGTNSGDSGFSASGSWGGAYGNADNINSNIALTYVSQMPGYGAMAAYSWVGNAFQITGSGSRSGNVIAKGQLVFETNTEGQGATATTTVTLHVIDLTNGGTDYSQQIWQDQTSQIIGNPILRNQAYNVGKSLTLIAGHKYVAYVEVDSASSVYGAGEATSDAGNWDGMNRYVSVPEIDVQFH